MILVGDVVRVEWFRMLWDIPRNQFRVVARLMTPRDSDGCCWFLPQPKSSSHGPHVLETYFAENRDQESLVRQLDKVWRNRDGGFMSLASRINEQEFPLCIQTKNQQTTFETHYRQTAPTLMPLVESSFAFRSGLSDCGLENREDWRHLFASMGYDAFQVFQPIELPAGPITTPEIVMQFDRTPEPLPFWCDLLTRRAKLSSGWTCYLIGDYEPGDDHRWARYGCEGLAAFLDTLPGKIGLKDHYCYRRQWAKSGGDHQKPPGFVLVPRGELTGRPADNQETR